MSSNIVKIVLLSNKYDAGNGLLKEVKYNNNQISRFDYDKLGRMIKKQNLAGKVKTESEYTYDDKNRLVQLSDSENNLTTKVDYDTYGRIARIRRSDSIQSTFTFDNDRNSVSKAILKLFGLTQTVENTFGPSGILEKSKIKPIDDANNQNNYIWGKYTYDELGRIKFKDTSNFDESAGIRHEISYANGNSTNSTTRLVESIQATNSSETLNKKFSYEYDNLGNISIVKENNATKIEYFYDDFNQLKRENNAYLGQSGQTVIYEYDLAGNILKKEIYTYVTGNSAPSTLERTATYSYNDSNWKDKLSSYHDGENEHKIIYDGIGNPTNYRDGWKFEWKNGKRLGKAINSCYNIEYKYDDGGIRTQKTVNSITTDFVSNGIQVLAQKSGDETIVWQIDGNGETVGFNYKGTEYLYIKNAQGDVIGITDADGNLKVEYTYDSWGKLVSINDTSDCNIGEINPIRYRGYYYDSETGLYYLNARYYDPETGRFINADDNLEDGLNLFRYCHNDPANRFDPDGMYDRKAAHLYAITYYKNNNSEYPDFGNNGDCANFVSQCLKAGGFETNDKWYCKHKTDLGSKVVGIVKPYKKWDYSNAWSCVHEQYKYFKDSDLTNGEVIINSNDEIKSVVNAENDRVRMGDIMYLQWDKDHPHHATIITSVRDNMIYYNAHTEPRDDQPLSEFFKDNPKGKAYILKIK